MKTHIHLPLLRAIVAAWLFVSGSLVAAEPGAAPSLTRSGEKKIIPYRITKGDELSIQIVGEPDLSAVKKRVEARGTITLAYVEDVRVQGLTVGEAADAIEKAYKDGRILRKPEVTVNVEVYARRVVNVTGFVKAPQMVDLPPEEQWTIRDVISKCGGFDDTAKGSEVRITRSGPDGKDEVFIKDVQAAMMGKKSANAEDASFIIEPGDSIYVPQRLF